MTVQDLIEIAEDFQARAEDTPEILDKELRFASQPEWPFEYHIQSHNWPENGEAVYMPEGRQIGYLDPEIKEKLDW